jgi:Peptidase A4 family
MHCTRLGILGALAFLPAFAQVSSVSLSQDATSQSATEKIAPRQLGPIRDRLDHFDGTSDSTNWSGYAVLGSSFTSAKGSWVVPAASCGGVRGDQYAAFWVGLDGYSSSTVEQTGTLSDCDGRNPSYYAWYEFYPNPMYEITAVPVAPGNRISASVVYSGGKFTVTLTNESTGKSYSTSSTVSGAARSSAEWIVEAPCCTNSGGILPLSDFGTGLLGYDSTGVSGTNYATDSTTSGPIGGSIGFPSADIEEINKVSSSTSPQTSTCSALSSDGTSFSCTWAK